MSEEDAPWGDRPVPVPVAVAAPSDGAEGSGDEHAPASPPRRRPSLGCGGRFTERELEYLQRTFDRFDNGRTTTLAEVGMRSFARHLGVEVSDDQLLATLEAVDENGNGDFTFEDFLTWLVALVTPSPTPVDEYAVLKAKMRARNIRPLSNSQIRQLLAVFEHFDEDGSGGIDADELGSVFRAMGQEMQEEELLEMVRRADDDGDGTIQFDEFIMMMCGSFGVTHAFDQDLLEAFHRFDQVNSGVISTADLAVMVRQLVGPNLSDEDVTEVVELAHTRGDGYVDYMRWDALWDASRGVTF